MAKLVVLSASMAGRSHELKVDKTTIGRVDDNTFQIAEPSVSSHHCEVLLQGNTVVIKDLNSTNGTFINGEKITESALKPGQTLRLGQIELRLETEGMPAPAPAPATSAALPPAAAPLPTAAPSGKKLEQTMVMQRGVSLDELEQGRRPSGFDTTSKAFSKKSNQTNRWFLIGGIIAIVVISLFLLYAFSQIKK
jgi:predicted component of type VI protein secretion system